MQVYKWINIYNILTHNANTEIGNFNIFLDTNLEVKGGSLCLKKKSLAKLIKIKEHLDLCDKWRLRNLDAKQSTFRQKHVSGFIQRR